MVMYEKLAQQHAHMLRILHLHTSIACHMDVQQWNRKSLIKTACTHVGVIFVNFHLIDVRLLQTL